MIDLTLTGDHYLPIRIFLPAKFNMENEEIFPRLYIKREALINDFTLKADACVKGKWNEWMKVN